MQGGTESTTVKNVKAKFFLAGGSAFDYSDFPMEADRDSWVVTGKKIIEEDQLRVLRESSEADPVRACKQ